MSDVAILEPVVNLSLLYNAFEPSTAEKHDLVWRETATLADYLEGLPEDTEWLIFHNGYQVPLEAISTVSVAEGDNIGLVVVPQGGNTLKTIFKIVLVAAAAVAGFYLGGVPGMIIGGALASIATTVLMAPKAPKGNKEETASFGIDGAKNSATEGIPYPIVYGKFRIGGNFADIYTENVGDDQYLYIRTVLSDGRLSAIDDIEINEQPIANFSNVEVRKSLGTLSEPVNDWFRNSIRQVNKAAKVDTAWITHTTTAPVDKVRFDLVFTSGLVKVSEKKGTYSSNSVTFQAEYRPLDSITKVATGPWVALPIGTPSTYQPGVAAPTQIVNISGSSAAIISASAPLAAVAAGTPAQIQYKPSSSGVWTTHGVINAGNVTSNGYALATGGPVSVVGNTNITPQVSADFTIPLTNQSYDFQVVNGTLNQIQAEPQPASSSVTISDNRTRQIRRSLESGTVPEGFYEVRVRRTTTTSTDPYILDEVYLTDVAEIETDRVALRGTANLSLRIKLTDQLNNIPGVTALCTGGPIQQYDIDGNPTVEAVTDNNAWVALDMMLGQERGVGYSPDRIDWPRWLEFADYCTANGLGQNRVFEETTNFGDAFGEVLRGAQAAPVPYGTKHSVVIDQPREPTSVFTQANINKGTFAIQYSSITDRANEFEVTYYDKDDRNKQKVIRYVDPKVVAFSEIPRPVQIELKGCDNVTMARRELWRAIYSNRYIIRSLSFEANLDAINVGIGEVSLIHHDQMEWANSGRLQAGSTASSLRLDQLVTKEVGETYSALVHFDALNVGTRVVNSVVGSKILVTGASISGLGAQRVIVNGGDYEVVSLVDGGTYHTIQLASVPTGVINGSTLQFWKTDVLEQRAVSSIALAADGTSTVTLSTPLPDVPAEFSNFIYGKVENVIKPYALTGISGSGVEKRKLSFVEYNENIYLPPETIIPQPIAQVNDRIVSHVENLLFDYDLLTAPDATSINARLHWSPAAIRNYGGADIYMALNGSGYRTVGSALNVSEYHIQLAPKDEVEFKVVAYSVRGDRAVFSTAPSVKGTISPVYPTLDFPTSLTSLTTSFEVNGTILLSWSPPVDPQGITGYELEWKLDADTQWNNVGIIQGLQYNIPAVGLGTFDYRVKSIGGFAFSLWAESTHTVVAPTMNGAVSTLKVANSAGTEFSGRDAQFTWVDTVRDQLYFLDYRIRVLTTGDALIRTEYSSVPSYTYTFEKNIEDGSGIPRRNFKVEVRQRGRQGQLSNASTLTVINPAPAAPGYSASVADKVATLKFVPPTDPDYQSIKVWLGTAPNVPEIAGNVVHDGVDTNVTLNVDPSTTYYVRFAAVDAFGVSSVRNEQTFTTAALVGVDYSTLPGAPDTLADLDAAAAAALATAGLDIDDLQTTFGTTVSAAASAAAAAADEALAEAHKNAAGLSATNASGSAATASGQATISTNQASAAATSASLSATHSGNALNSLLGVNPRGMSGGATWYGGAPALVFATDGGAPVINYTSGANGDIYPKWAYPAIPGRTYRTHLRARTATGSRQVSIQRGSSNALINSNPSYEGTVANNTFNTVYSTQTAEYTVPTSPTTAFQYFFFTPLADSEQLFIQDFWVEDITELNLATTQAGISTSQAAAANISAGTATTQANLSASYATTAKSAAQQSYPSTFENQGEFFAGDFGGAANYNDIRFVNDATYGPVAEHNIPSFGYGAISWKKRKPNTPVTVWKMRALVRKLAGADSNIEFRLEYYNKPLNDGTSPVVRDIWASPNITSATPVWIEHEFVSLGAYGFAGPEIILWGPAVGVGSRQQCLALELIDVTESTTASSQANIATTQATTATAQGAIATAAAALSASITPGSRTKDPFMTLWTTTSDLTQWEIFSGSVLIARTPGFQAQYSCQMVGNAAEQSGQLQNIPFSPGWWVEEAEVTLNSGTLRGVGMHTHSYTGVLGTGASTGDASTTDFWARYGNGVVGQTYRIGVIRQWTTACLSAKTYAMCHWSGLPFEAGDISAANSVTFRYCGIRPATDMEIRDQTVLAPMQATVATNSSAITTLNGSVATLNSTVSTQGTSISTNATAITAANVKLATYLQRVSAGAGSAEIEMVALDINGNAASSISLKADKIKLGNVATPALEIVNGVSTFNGELNVGGTTGARTNILKDVIKIFDTSNNIRVKIGNLAL